MARFSLPSPSSSRCQLRGRRCQCQSAAASATHSGFWASAAPSLNGPRLASAAGSPLMPEPRQALVRPSGPRGGAAAAAANLGASGFRPGPRYRHPLHRGTLAPPAQASVGDRVADARVQRGAGLSDHRALLPRGRSECREGVCARAAVLSFTALL
eukprot:5565304-Alexandrium_andersonii.AAC.1